ncbi:class I SAM-dependent methyltransferase [Streptomyces coffeae]|uniref:Methyltransferase domain-containing protein n=1 Tax=Streptomyces coffeae TaxID=621382 RepID=A0ABS1NK17_9ACTN|nr:class I SAM-dependent methyltransferase [Streptomyces coffeae]MBL1100267.1 methyltransferase domain-containing protein [Streptomyces coffeae]
MTIKPPATTGQLGEDAALERARLASIQRNVDAFTIGLIEDLGIEASWNCLELGAGAGSIAYWLAERCPDGHVVAADIDTRHLDVGRAANLRVQEADISEEDYAPGSFDLIHARYLFCHLATRDEVIRRAAGWLSPGGRLVVEEPYHLPAETSPFPLVQRLLAAYQRKYSEQGADMTWARGLPAHLARCGLSEVSYSGNLGCMGGLDKDRWLPLITQAAPALITDGLITETDLTAFSDLLEDSAFIDIPQITIAAWGRRPLEHAAERSSAV